MASLSTVSDNSTALSKIIDEIAYSILTAVLSEYSADVAKLLQPFPSIEQDTDRPLNEHCEERLFDQLKALDTLSVPSAATVQLANRIAVSLSGDDLSCVILHLHTQVVESDGSKKRRSLFNPGRPGNSNFCRSPKMSFVNAGTSVKTTSKSRTLLPRPSAPTHTDDKVTLMLTLCLPSLDRKVGGRNKTGWKWKSVTTYPKIESRASVGVIYIGSRYLANWEFELSNVGRITVDPDVRVFSLGERVEKKAQENWTSAKAKRDELIPGAVKTLLHLRGTT